MKYLSMFSGIGGFEHGIEKAVNYIRSVQQENCKGSEKCNGTKNKLLQWQCVGYSEINRYADAVYKKHYPGRKNYGDASKIVPRSLPDFELLVAGIPCQSFSVSGKRKGFNDPRGALFFDLARVLSYKRPRYILLENVRGLLSHESGKTFQTILKVLSNLGYSIEWQVLNSKDYGVPQNRERVFLIGYLRQTSRPKVFPITENNKKTFKLYKQQVGTITARRGNNQSDGDYVVKSRRETLQEITKSENQSYRVYNSEGIAKTLASNAGGIGAKTGLYLVDSNKVLKKGLTLFSNVTENNIPSIEVNGQKYSIRRLTPKECERLQGFPDDWTKYGVNERGTVFALSDAQRYRLIGNAVTTNVVQYIIEKFIGGKNGKD